MNPYEELRHAAETAIADLQAGVSDTGFIIRYLQRALNTSSLPARGMENREAGTADNGHERQG